MNDIPHAWKFTHTFFGAPIFLQARNVDFARKLAQILEYVIEWLQYPDRPTPGRYPGFVHDVLAALILSYGQGTVGGRNPAAFLAADRLVVHQFFRSWLNPPSTGPMTYGLAEPYQNVELKYPEWYFSQPNSNFDHYLPDLISILPKLGKNHPGTQRSI